MNNGKWEFIHNEILSASVLASVRQGVGRPVYKSGTDDSDKQEFRNFLKQKLLEYAEKYKSGKISDDNHFKNIEKLAKEISETYGKILAKDKFGVGKFRIGRTQKLLNLYLKYLWCSGKINEPPHCPFDSIVIGNLDGDIKNTRFTEFDDIDIYKNLVEMARKKADRSSLSEWELNLFNKRNPAYRK